MRERECPVCFEEYTPKKISQQVCSKACARSVNAPDMVTRSKKIVPGVKARQGKSGRAVTEEFDDTEGEEAVDGWDKRFAESYVGYKGDESDIY